MDNRKFGRLRRWAREGIILVLLTLAVVWGVDRYREPTLPASFSATPMQSIDGNIHDISALSQERPLLIYVWATWCKNCLAMEKTTFANGDVRKELEKYAVVRLQAEDLAAFAVLPEFKDLGIKGIPAFVIFE